jgi:hypothetical protein
MRRRPRTVALTLRSRNRLSAMPQRCRQVQDTMNEREAPQLAPPAFFSSTGRLMQPAEKPDEKDDRDGNSNQPEQKTATHTVSSVGVCAVRTPDVKLGSGDRMVANRQASAGCVEDREEVTARQTT